ncbi:hypothetical protein MACH10_00250 [Thalassospira tepidiphila]|uniref:hypothetical protein n=1 Tax=Thalassospira tepidiphila TaxID=393657 RepID=UPI002922278A|nr:hypothetical protein MACH10_00250 [Thalassospira tepidiphila]
MKKLYGQEALQLIETQLEEHQEGIRGLFAPYDKVHMVEMLHDEIRAIEEFINIPLFQIADDTIVHQLRATSLSFQEFEVNSIKVMRLLQPFLQQDVLHRYLFTFTRISAIANAFKLNGEPHASVASELGTIGRAVDYFQSRRRHLVTLFYSAAAMCSGREKIDSHDVLNVFLPAIEQSCSAITGFHYKRVMFDILDDFHLTLDDHGALASYDYQVLDKGFMEPERASILALVRERSSQIDFPESTHMTGNGRVFSAKELRSNAKVLQAVYQQFELGDAQFSELVELINIFSRHCRDGYFIEIDKARFNRILQKQKQLPIQELERILVNRPSRDYAKNSNSYEPFVENDNHFISNVNLLNRFLYDFKNRHLESRRRFQIHAGFIFEDMIKRELEEMGFDVKGIKRIRRQEFDVVTTCDSVIYNFQCKNNYIDLAKVETDRKLFVRYNNSRVHYYRGALKKERQRQREELLKEKLGLNDVEHYVISRFPVICNDTNIINYNQINKLKQIVNSTAI